MISPLQKFKNVARGLLQSWGSRGMKRAIWNREFANGRWKILDETPGDCVYLFLEKYGRQGRILDLGCGAGNTGNELRYDAYADYLGVDISDVAIERAREKSLANGRSRNHYCQSDIYSFVPPYPCDVILFRETIFYIPLPRIRGMLERYCRHLTPRGCIMVRMYDRVKYASILRVIEDHFHVNDWHRPEGENTVLVVFRP